jgi:hypothetical protein
MLGRLALFAAFATLVGCAAESARSDVKAEKLPTEPATLKDVTVDQAKLTWGLDGSYGGPVSTVAGAHAFLFDGEDGDAVSASAHSQTAGTLYVLQQTNAGFVVVAQNAVVDNGSVDVVLHGAGTYAVAYAPQLTIDATSFAGSVTLGGTPASAAHKLMMSVRDSFTKDAGVENSWMTIESSALPKGVSASGHSYCWSLDGQDIYVVTGDDDAVSFYAADGSLVASGGANANAEFVWRQ